MRPATVLAIVLLLLTLAIAGVVFVIQLLSVT
jgi:CHASE1-domain containing sensor protein